MNYKKTGLLLFMAFVSSASLAQGTGTSSYYELHNRAVASAAYNDFRSGTGTDPFTSLNRGYKYRYAEDLAGSFSEQIDAIMYQLMENENLDFIKQTRTGSEVESESLKSIYQSHFDSDGSFDAESYAQSYSAHMDSRRLARQKNMDNRFDSVMNTIGEGLDLRNGYRNSLNSDISSAQVNLIHVISEDNLSRKASINNIMVNASERLGDRAELINDTLARANQYADCGFACEFPEVEVEPIEPPQPTPPNPAPPQIPPEDCPQVVYVGGIWHVIQCR